MLCVEMMLGSALAGVVATDPISAFFLQFFEKALKRGIAEGADANQ